MFFLAIANNNNKNNIMVFFFCCITALNDRCLWYKREKKKIGNKLCGLKLNIGAHKKLLKSAIHLLACFVCCLPSFFAIHTMTHNASKREEWKHKSAEAMNGTSIKINFYRHIKVVKRVRERMLIDIYSSRKECQESLSCGLSAP